MKKVGILGGTFNPIHNGHLLIAWNAYYQCGLDEVWLMPSGNPPHKDNSEILSGTLRKQMVELAVADNDVLMCSEFELNRKGYVYTAETLELLRSEYSDTEWYFIIGEDSLDSFSKWYCPDKIVKSARIIVAVRGKNTGIEKKIRDFNEKYLCEAILINTPYVDISSSDIRERISNCNTIRYMVPENVREYISTNNLYKS